MLAMVTGLVLELVLLLLLLLVGATVCVRVRSR